jgi:hypothetical protein
MRFKKPLAAVLAGFVPAMLTLSACGTAQSSLKHHANDGLAVKKHYRGEVSYTVDWRACLVSVIPLPKRLDEANGHFNDAKYIIDFPNTLKKLQFVNVYESPRDLYIALESFPGVNTDCLPPPSSIPTSYAQPSSPQPFRPQPSSSQPAPQPSSPQASSPANTATPTPVPTNQCVLLEPDQVDCTSSNPEVTLEGENIGDTSGCTFSDQIIWGDGSQQSVQFPGANGTPSFVANHTYEQQGTFSITAIPTVVSGNCTSFNGYYTFTYN